MRAAFAWFRLGVFVIVLIVSLVLKRWFLVAIVGGCLVLVIVRAFRARPRTPSPSDAPSPPENDPSWPAAEPTEPGGYPAFEMTPATVDALRSRGGNLYIWSDRAGLFRASATAPDEAIAFDQLFSHGCSIHIDREISRDAPLIVSWKRLPWPHFSVTYEMRTGKGIIDAIFDAW